MSVQLSRKDLKALKKEERKIAKAVKARAEILQKSLSANSLKPGSKKAGPKDSAPKSKAAGKRAEVHPLTERRCDLQACQAQCGHNDSACGPQGCACFPPGSMSPAAAMAPPPASSGCGGAQMPMASSMGGMRFWCARQ